MSMEPDSHDLSVVIRLRDGVTMAGLHRTSLFSREGWQMKISEGGGNIICCLPPRGSLEPMSGEVFVIPFENISLIESHFPPVAHHPEQLSTPPKPDPTRPVKKKPVKK